MRRFLRMLLNRAFTMTATGSVILMALALVAILGPMLHRGVGAVFFRGTYEFRRMQRTEELFARGDREALARESREIAAAQAPVYEILNGPFSMALDSALTVQDVRRVYRELGKQLDNRIESGSITRDDKMRIRRAARKLRDALQESLETNDNETALAGLAQVREAQGDPRFAGTVLEKYFTIAADYGKVVRAIDLGKRDEYRKHFLVVKDTLRRLLGPASGETASELMQNRYGATRWDRVRPLLDQLLWEEQWVPAENSGDLVKKRTPRADRFRGTDIERLFPLVAGNIEKMTHPRSTFYWQYFIDDSPPGHYFGGVGPEIVGTLLLTVLTMLFAVPIGITTAAYLVECARENLFVRFVRMCINTLAGVPSIVFGLFGLAFFMVTLQPALGLHEGSSILAGSLTLSVLVLPIMIRASEEAIRAVPSSYKEASLALGAGSFRTFMTVTLPAALPGVLTGIILSMSRAAGETAPILFTAAVASRLGIPDSILEGGTRALSYGAYDIAVGDRIGAQVPHNQYGMIMTLILLVLVLNIAAILVRSRMSAKLRGA
jgi:phosphate transport system permease protein